MDFTYFYRAEMPNSKECSLDSSELHFLGIWDKTIQTIIKVSLNNLVPKSKNQKLKQS